MVEQQSEATNFFILADGQSWESEPTQKKVLLASAMEKEYRELARFYYHLCRPHEEDFKQHCADLLAKGEDLQFLIFTPSRVAVSNSQLIHLIGGQQQAFRTSDPDPENYHAVMEEHLPDRTRSLRSI